MRSLSICALLAVLLTPSAAAPPEAITIVLDFKGPHSEASINQMKQEFEDLMQGSGIRFDWATREMTQHGSFSNLVLVRLKGKCILEPVGYLYDERGPMAFTYSTDGAVQPFSEVECDKVIASVRSAMSGGDFGHADQLLGRALARVVAHEVIHILTKSGAHGKEGVAKEAISGRQLISPDFKIAPADLSRIYFEP